jgi:SAM-dependent methyltransferase
MKSITDTKAVRVLTHLIAPIVRLPIGLPLKRYSASTFWRREIQVYIRWYEGKLAELYGVPAPTDDTKVKDHDLKENAIRTWSNADINKYPNHLLVSRDFFRGKRVLDVGCGPIPYALAFDDCEIFGLDPLIKEYKKSGFPLDNYSKRLTYVGGIAEKMQFEDAFFDAVISVNAIDHVDDFPLAAREICRVLRPEGILRLEVHYHRPTVTEPWALNDDIMMACFGHLGVRKIRTRPFIELFPASKEREGELVVWSNRDYLN